MTALRLWNTAKVIEIISRDHPDIYTSRQDRLSHAQVDIPTKHHKNQISLCDLKASKIQYCKWHDGAKRMVSKSMDPNRRAFGPKIIIQKNWMLSPEFWSLLTGTFALYIKVVPSKISNSIHFQKIEKIPQIQGTTTPGIAISCEIGFLLQSHEPQIFSAFVDRLSRMAIARSVLENDPRGLWWLHNFELTHQMVPVNHFLKRGRLASR